MTALTDVQMDLFTGSNAQSQCFVMPAGFDIPTPTFSSLTSKTNFNCGLCIFVTITDTTSMYNKQLLEIIQFDVSSLGVHWKQKGPWSTRLVDFTSNTKL